MGIKRLQEIDQLLDKSVRPQMLQDGGDVRLLYLKNHDLHLEFMGACRKCPHSGKTTIKAIESVVHRYDKKIELVNETPVFRK